ncbi:MFS transporter [Paenibacillus sp. GCM10023252]|uniref:MFS transporter n=1 Tax=Paenibacillus sp. GCM10023252 TaxID=3252649 RepID=UPI003614A162
MLQSSLTEAAYPEAGLGMPRPALFRNRAYLLLLCAYTLSLFGNSMHSIALNLWVLNTTGSATLMTVMMVTNLLISFLFGSFAGTIADRFNRRTMIWLADLLRCILVCLIALAVSQPHPSFTLLVGLSGLVTFLGLFQSPALQASLITIVGKEQISRAVGFMNIADNVSRTVGFAVGGIFVAAFGGAMAILLDGILFLVSCLLVLLAGAFPASHARSSTASSAGVAIQEPKEVHVQSTLRGDFLTGIRYIWSNPFAKAVTLLSPMLLLFFMSAFMLTQVMAVKVWKASPMQFGFIEACIPLGYMLGSGLIVLMGSRMRHRGRLIMGHLLLMGPLYMALSFTSHTTTAIPVILLIGYMFSFCTLLITIILRLEIAEELQGRVFGTMGSLMSVAPSVGLVISSYNADLYGSETTMFVTGALLFVFAATCAVRLKVIRSYN